MASLLRPFVLAIPVLVTGCARQPVPPTDAQVATVLGGDASFGSAAALERRLFADTRFLAGDDAAARTRFVDEWRSRLDAAAAARVRAAVDGTDVDVAAAFFASDAGRALAAAREMALALAHYAGGQGFPATTANVYGDPTQVGKEHLRGVIADAQQRLAAGTLNESPARLAITVASAGIEPDQARSIGEFFASASGRRWLEAETAAHADTEASFDAFADAALAAGIVRERDPGSDKLPLLVPKQNR